MQSFLSSCPNVTVTGVDLSSLTSTQLTVLKQQVRYCQAMTDADIATLEELTQPAITYTHMSGRQQTREEYFGDIADGSLRYFSIGVEKPVITVKGDTATVAFTSVLNANAYGARGTYRMAGIHHWQRQEDGSWCLVNS